MYSPTISTKKGLSEHCCFKKRYSDSFYFTKRRDAMKCVLFSYILHYPFLFAFRWGYRRISQRICQRHGKIARKHFIYKDRVRLDNEFGSFFYFTTLFFAQRSLVVDIFNGNKIFIFNVSTYAVLPLPKGRK